jgi:ketosteroid isomerase-like protein
VGNNQLQRAAEAMASAMPRRAALRRVGLGGLATGLVLSLTTAESSGQSSLVTASTEAAARRAINALNQALASGDMSVLGLAFATNYVNHTPHRSLQSGQLFSPDLAGLQAALGELRGAVPDAVFVVDDVVASGDSAAVRATFRGTIAAPLAAGANPRLSVGGMALLRIADGRVVESWDYSEAAEVLAAISQPPPQPTTVPTTPPPTPPATPGEVREVHDFQEVALEGVGTLLIQQGDTESLSIEADPKVLQRIATEVRKGKLIISPSRSFKTKEPITYHLGVKQLTGIELSGAGVIQVAAFNADQLQLVLDGAGSLTIDQLTANTLDVSASQNGGVQLAGTVDQQTVTLSGAAKYIAGDLQSRVASVTADGASKATVNVSESLEAQAGGASRIEYIGNPEVRQNVSAAGSVVNVG